MVAADFLHRVLKKLPYKAYTMLKGKPRRHAPLVAQRLDGVYYRYCDQ